MVSELLKKNIIAYYETCESNYKRWWDLDRSLAMHAGFWDETTKTLPQALMRENEILAELAHIQPGDRVLDAGCGVGGSAIFLATRKGAKVVGITLSERQVETARKKSSEQKMFKDVPEFFVMDYTQTSFPTASFDVVWALESVCHADKKRDFIQEAYRVLKPGGRLIVADGFHVKNEYTESEKTLLLKAVNGWAVDSMESIPNFLQDLNAQGFTNIVQRDATDWVKPSSYRLFLYSFPALSWSILGEYLGWSTKHQTRDFKSYHYQFRAVKKQLCKYMIFYAEKPL
jgi:tocopherol O-methyltransferase